MEARIPRLSPFAVPPASWLLAVAFLPMGTGCDEDPDAPPPSPDVTLSPETPTTTDDLILGISGRHASGEPDEYRVRWLANGQEQPDLAGLLEVPAALTTKGETWKAVVVAVDAEGLKSEPSAASVTVANTPPVVVSVDLVPDEPREGDTLTAVVATSDADGDAVTPSFAWSVDGALGPDVSDTLDSSAWDAGEVVHVVVTPFDGTDAGLTVQSDVVTVLGTAPAITGVAVDPATGGEATVFTCAPAGWSDPDPADAEGYAYQWTVNDVVVATKATLDGASFDEGDVIACAATPDDGLLLGPAHTSTGVTIVNTAPSATSATISPSAPREADTLTVAVSGWSDPDPADAESYTYAWYAGAELRGTAATLTGAHFDKGDALHVVVTPWDGTDTGPVVTSDAVTAANTPPTVTLVDLTPDDPVEGIYLLAVALTSDADGDPVTPSFAWYVDGVLVTGTDQWLASSAWDKGDVVHTVVTPHDGTDAGLPVQSQAVTVVGSPPAITGVAIDPTTGGETTTFDCVPEGWSDPDPDPFGWWRWEWTVDGVVVAAGQHGNPLPEPLDGSSFDKGEVIACTVRPGDDDGVGAPLTSAGVTIGNTPPSVTGVTITPSQPREADTVEALVGGLSDPDPADVPDYTHAWYIGGWPPHPGQTPVSTSATLTGADFDKNQMITVVVTPWDGTDAGPAVASGCCVTSRNTPPVATSLVVSPTTLYTDTSATAAVSGWYDPDPADHETYYYSWSVNMTGVGQEPTLHHSAFARGDEVRLGVVPDDGVEFGPGLSAGPFTVQNRPPTAPTVRIAPADPRPGEPLACDLETPSADVDGDALLYDFSWLRDGVPTPWYATGASDDEVVAVPVDETRFGEAWTCEVTPDDGFDVGPTGSAEVAVSCAQSEIPPGMVGIEGCVTLSESFPTVGFDVYAPFPFPEWTESTDGDVATATLSGWGDLVAYRRGGLPRNAIGSRMFFEIEPQYGALFDELSVYMQDDWTTCGVVIREHDALFTDINNAISFSVSPGMHTYDMRILPHQGGVELLMDGVSLGVLPGGRTQGDGSPFMEVFVRGDTGSGFRLDNLSFTPAP